MATLSPTSIHVEAPSAMPVWASASDLITKAIEALHANNSAEANELIKQLKTHFPTEANRIFYLTWEAEGKPTSETAPGIAHPNFGKVAFFGEEGRRSISVKQKLEILFRVVKEIDHPRSSCVFCDEAIIEAQLVYSDGKHWDVLQSLTPATKGHLLVIPKRHVERFDQLTTEEGAALTQVTKKCAAVFQKVYGLPENAYLVIQKNGVSAGQSVKHVHVHLVPTPPESLGSIVPKIFGERDRLSKAQIAQEVKTLRPAFAEVDPILSACNQLEQHITAHSSSVNLGICWRLEALLPHANGFQRQKILELLAKVNNGKIITTDNFYPHLGVLDNTFKPSALPFSIGRDRHPTCIPYAFNQLHLSEEIPMNGSRVKFPEHGESYVQAPTYCIAMSAPMPSYISHTLKMYAEENVGIVVNLTEFEEGHHIKADRYLPEKQGDVIAKDGYTLTNTATSSRSLSSGWNLEQKTCEVRIGDKTHSLTQFHVQGWKDFTPGNPEAIAKLIMEVAAYEQAHPEAGKIAIHCSGGVGRTGVFIAGKKIYELIQKGIELDIKTIAAAMRMQRFYLGGSKEQYQVLWKLKEIFQEPQTRAKIAEAAQYNDFSQVKSHFNALPEKTRHALCGQAYAIAKSLEMNVSHPQFGEHVFTQLSDKQFDPIRLQAIHACLYST